MNIFEVAFVLLCLFVSYVIAKYLFVYLGWWSAVLGLVLGFGFTTLIGMLAVRVFGRKASE